MRVFWLCLGLWFAYVPLPSIAKDILCADDRNSYIFDNPVNFVARHNQKKDGLCVFYQRVGYNFNTSPVIIYANLIHSRHAYQEAIDKTRRESETALRARERLDS